MTEARALEGTVARSPAQALARLHVAAAAGSVPDDDLGRPRQSGRGPGTVVAARLSALADLLQASRNAPALLLAAVAHAEVITAEIFPTDNGVVARALRTNPILVSRGLDITGVAVWEGAQCSGGPQCASRRSAGYADGSRRPWRPGWCTAPGRSSRARAKGERSVTQSSPAASASPKSLSRKGVAVPL